MDFSTIIRTLRKRKGFSQDQMADLLGINQKAYSKIERGKTKLNYERIVQLARIFDLTIWEFINLNQDFLLLNKPELIAQNSAIVSMELFNQIIQKYDEKIVQIEKDLEHALKEIEKYKGESS
ncbi:MAG: hypothetical protein KFKLKKLM_02301 [Flavobacteriales bacterium]|nr:hypothetical protein [Flavobacteriales bacterium]